MKWVFFHLKTLFLCHIFYCEKLRFIGLFFAEKKSQSRDFGFPVYFERLNRLFDYFCRKKFLCLFQNDLILLL